MACDVSPVAMFILVVIVFLVSSVKSHSFLSKFKSGTHWPRSGTELPGGVACKNLNLLSRHFLSRSLLFTRMYLIWFSMSLSYIWLACDHKEELNLKIDCWFAFKYNTSSQFFPHKLATPEKLSLPQAIRATHESTFGEMHSINYTMDRVTFMIMLIIANATF